MYTRIAANKRNSVLLILGFIALVAALDWVIAAVLGQRSLAVPILLIGLVYAGISYAFSTQIALAMSGAREIAKADDPELYRLVENLAITAGLPMPKVYISDDPALNAFATGRDPKHAVVCVTSGIRAALEKTELEGVIAHELSHVGNYDIRFMALVAALAAAVSVIADFLLRTTIWNRDSENRSPYALVFALAGAILAPLAAILIQLAVSRQREYLADASGALLTRYPEGLASALEKIDEGSTIKRANSATAPLYIANPLKGRSLAGLFDTHPPIADRVRRLREMENHM
jgi:heat shock protein HtpX